MGNALKVVCFMSEAQFNAINPVVPPGLEIVHRRARTEEDVANACRDADVLLAPVVPSITSYIIDRAPNLRLIQVNTAGYNHIDIEAAASRGIPVANSGGANSPTVADYVMLVSLLFFRPVDRYDAGVKAGDYVGSKARLLERGNFDLLGKTLGIIGLGNIGKQVARRAHGFDMRILYYDIIRPTREEETELGVRFAPFEEVLGSADILTMHVPLTIRTQHMISFAQLDLLKPTALLINAARGPVVNSAALVDALIKGKIAGAAIDVFDEEPIPADHPYLSLPEAARDRLLVTPHIAGSTREAWSRMLQAALDNIGRLAQDLKPLNVVNGIE